MIHDRIRNYIEHNGIKQADISSRTHISAEAVSRVLLGERAINAEEYAKICNALNVPYSTFIK